MAQALVEPSVLEFFGVVHVQSPAGVDEMLELVDQRRRREVAHVRLLSDVAEPAGGIGYERVIHLGEVARWATDQPVGAGLREEVALVEKPANHTEASARRELVHFLRKQDDRFPVLIDVRWLAEGLNVEWTNQRVEQRRKPGVLGVGESAGGVRCIGDDDRRT